MSKSILLKVQDDIFTETNNLTKLIKIPRNLYINKALSFYNQLYKRKILKDKLKKEINLVETNSLEVLEEFEKIEDDNIE